MIRRVKAVATAAVVLSLGLLAGCGGKSTKVNGKVTYQGKTVVWGTVTLVDGTGMFYQGPIALDGSYEIAGVPAGPVKIAVFSPKPGDESARAGKAGERKAGGVDLEDPRAKFKKAPVDPALPLPPPEAWFPIPTNLSDPTTSGLSGEVKSGTPLNIDIP